MDLLVVSSLGLADVDVLPPVGSVTIESRVGQEQLLGPCHTVGGTLFPRTGGRMGHAVGGRCGVTGTVIEHTLAP